MPKKTLNRIYSQIIRLQPKAPDFISVNFKDIPSNKTTELKNLIINNLLKPLSKTHHETTEGEKDIVTHINGRLNHFRHFYIPWINSIIEIKGKKILEIGCGTGASTQALAEQGGIVYGIDVDEKALEIAKYRIANCGLNATFECENAINLGSKSNHENYDIIIFFASLEHMTIPERIISLENAFKLLKNEGALFILEAPNRLWFYDMHTSFLPFYFWLPDDLAMKYSAYSDRQLFRENISSKTSTIELARWGRGVSFHEFQLAGIPDSTLKKCTSAFDFHMKRKLLKKIAYRLNLNYRYKKIIRKITPKNISNAFLEPFLDLAILKKSNNHNQNR